MSGDIESTRLFSHLIVQRLNGKLIKNGGSEQLGTIGFNSALRITQYSINIMSNTADPKVVVLKVIENDNTGLGEVKIEHGSEYVEWQSNIYCLCDCCTHNISKSKTFYVCYKAAEPNEAIRTGQCLFYKFSDKKYRSHLDNR